MDDIALVGDPILTRACPEETVFDAALALIAEHLATATRRPGRFAVAAPQLGVSRRLFTFHYASRMMAMVNPRIIYERGTWEYREGCLSLPGFRWSLMRPKQVTVAYQDLDGKEQMMEADEFVARGIQHEVDHLNGILLPDRIREAAPTMTRQVRRHVSRELAKHGVLMPA